MTKKSWKWLGWVLLVSIFLCFFATSEPTWHISCLYAADDIRAKLNDASGVSKFAICDSGDVSVATIDSDGNIVLVGTVAVQGNAFSVGTSTFVITGGNVSIGVAPTTAKLEVRSSDTQNYSLAVGTSTIYSLTVSTSGNVIIRGDLSLDIDTGIGPKLLLYDHTETPWKIHNQVGRIRFAHGDTEKMTLTGAGRLGVGVNAPESKFHINAGSDDYSILTEGGRAGFGTTSPGAALDVNSPTTNARIFQARCGAAFGLVVSTICRVSVAASMPTAGYAFQVGNEGDGSGAISNAWNLYSDRKWKKDISSLVSADYEKLMKVIEKTDIVRYRYKGDKPDRKLRLGIIADDSPEEILSEEKSAISLGDTVAVLIAAVKYQNHRISELENEIKLLKKK